jgi:hypothetical protein
MQARRFLLLVAAIAALPDPLHGQSEKSKTATQVKVQVRANAPDLLVSKT